MELKVRLLEWSAGRPVAIIHKKLAERMSLHLSDRILIKKNSHKIISIVDISFDLVRENEIAVSTEISKEMSLSNGDSVKISLTSVPESLTYIKKKLTCTPLSKNELNIIVKDIVSNALSESEIAYFVSSIYNCGMSLYEIKNLTQSIASNGWNLDLKRKIVADKHSIGGVSGRTTPIIVSICASAGLVIPKTSSRAITTAAGTADAIETLCDVEFSVKEIKEIIKKTNACMVWGGGLGIAPADDKIIQVEKLIGLDPEPQLIASIMAKKIAVGAKYIVLHLPYGKYAKVTKLQAMSLKNKFTKIAEKFKIKLKCVLTLAEQPLGNGIGPVLEMDDVVTVLKRQGPCFLLEDTSLNLSAALLELSGKAKKGKGYKMAKEILDSGKAFEKFKEIIKAQRGSITPLVPGKYNEDICAAKTGKIKEINIKEINQVAIIAGCPLDKAAGIYLHKHLHDKVKKGDKLMTIYAESEYELKEAVKINSKLKPIKF